MSVDFDVLNKIVERAHKAMGKEQAKVYTTKDRKAMKKSSFCGPNSSFPITDCQHVGTARAYLNRSKFSEATKAKISACINRKAKALGCDKSNKEKSYLEYSYESLSDEQKILYDSDTFSKTKDLVEHSINNPDMELDFAGCKECV